MSATPVIEPLLKRLKPAVNACAEVRTSLEELFNENPLLAKTIGPNLRLWLDIIDHERFASSKVRERWLLRAAQVGIGESRLERLRQSIFNERDGNKPRHSLLQLARADVLAAVRAAECDAPIRRQIDHWLVKFAKESARVDAAREELIEQAAQRIEILSRKMLRRCSAAVRGNSQTGDVFIGAAMRLIRTLGDVAPLDSRAFFGLVGLQIRRELVEVARRVKASSRRLTDLPEPRPRRGDHPSSLECWARFHTAVERLPPVQNEVVSLHWYQGLTLDQIAEITGVNKDVVRRRWRSARDSLAAELKECVSAMLGD